MTVTIGRCSLDDAPYSISHSGDLLTFGIDIWAGSLAEAKAQRQQLLGLVPGEVIPVTSTEDADWDGFYSVIAVDIGLPEVYLSTYIMRCAVSLQRVTPGYGLPSWEAILSGITRTQTTAPMAGAYATYAIPAAAITRQGNGAPELTRANGDLLLLSSFDINFFSNAGPYSETDQYVVAPADFYNAAASVEYQVSSVWYPLVGRQLPEAAATTPSDVRVTTGAFRVTYNASGEFVAEVNASGVWEQLDANFEMTQEIAGSVPYDTDTFQPVTVRVLRNTPQQVVVEYRTVYDTASATGKATRTVQVAARRGQHHVDILYPAPTTTINDVRFGPTASAAATALGSYGLRKTSDDANGNRWVIATHEASASFNTTRGDINDDNVAYDFGFNVMLGVELGGSSASTDDTAAYVCGQWWVAVGEDHRMVV